MARNLNEDGTIREPCSSRWGKPPKDDSVRERTLMVRRWLWLLIPIAGIVPYVTDSRELTEDYGHYPWWL